MLGQPQAEECGGIDRFIQISSDKRFDMGFELRKGLSPEKDFKNLGMKLFERKAEKMMAEIVVSSADKTMDGQNTFRN
jgi:hypothetical protein